MVWEDGTAWKGRIPSKGCFECKERCLRRSWILETATDTWTVYCSHRHKSIHRVWHAEKLKRDRLYIEVRYVNATCLSMNTQTANQFFQLRENGEKMAYQIYSDCLLKYFDSSKPVAKVSITDFRNTLGNISPLNAHQMFNWSGHCRWSWSIISIMNIT